MIKDPQTKTFSRPSVVEELQAYIRNYIIDHQLRPDDPLPSSNELAANLGVSVNSIREALKALETLGVLEVRRGVGIFVRPLNFDAISKVLEHSFDFDPSTVAELLQIRKSLELSVVPETVKNIDKAGIQAIENLLNEWERNIPTDTWGKLDRQFHNLLNGYANNKILAILLDIFWVAYDNSDLATQHSVQDPYDTLKHHRMILAGVRVKDIDATISAILNSYHEIDERLSLIVHDRESQEMNNNI